MKFFHGYHPLVWDAQVKSGIFNEGDGLRIPMENTMEKERYFNNVARRDSHLYNILKNEKLPFYIDRLQGGQIIMDYPYDMDLLSELISFVGKDNFYGFQMHEWVSNYRSDLDKLLGLSDENWNKEAIKAEIRRVHPIPDVFIESMFPHEMEKYGRPKTIEDFLEIVNLLYQSRIDTQKLILPCDSVFMAYNLEIKKGSKRIMAEIGEQTNHARIQICYGRGMAKAHGVEFGTYYEPWGNQESFSACCYNRDGINEWGNTDENFTFSAMGENGGSARSLQERLYIYSYMNNVDFMSEEWSICNNFYDWHDFDLSPYGLINHRFASFRKKYSDVGQKLTPVCAVLSDKLDVLDNIDFRGLYCRLNLEGTPYRDKIMRLKQNLYDVFVCHSCTKHVAQNIILSNGDIPDAVDIVNYTENGALDKYKYLLDFTEEDKLSSTHKNICKISELQAIMKKELPCYVDGHLSWLVNERIGGGYYLTVFNNFGYDKTISYGERTYHEADEIATLSFKGEKTPVLCEGNAYLYEEKGMYKLHLPAASWCIIKF